MYVIAMIVIIIFPHNLLYQYNNDSHGNSLPILPPFFESGVIVVVAAVVAAVVAIAAAPVVVALALAFVLVVAFSSLLLDLLAFCNVPFNIVLLKLAIDSF